VKVLVIYTHPVEGSYASACRDRLLAGLDAARHDVRLHDLYAEDFRPELSAQERTDQFASPDTKPDIAQHAADLQWCDALVLVYPTWWSGQPAMLKGWIDRVWVHGVAYDLPAGANRIRPRLTNIRRIVAVTTHGSPKWINVAQGEPGKRVVTRSIRLLCSRRTRTSWVALYGIDAADDRTRARFLDRVERAGRSL
jgi:putative NADPH-quinone reductase